MRRPVRLIVHDIIPRRAQREPRRPGAAAPSENELDVFLPAFGARADHEFQIERREGTEKGAELGSGFTRFQARDGGLTQIYFPAQAVLRQAEELAPPPQRRTDLFGITGDLLDGGKSFPEIYTLQQTD
jgi:hypothetical protein